jgi:outer membrane protein OmpA-like peptidoglycan-associated protein
MNLRLDALRGLMVAALFATSMPLVGAAATPATTAVQDPRLASFAAAIDKARTEQVDALAPAEFAKVIAAFDDASKDAVRGRNPERVRERIAEGQAALQSASLAAAATREALSSVIKTREDTINAGAPRLAPESWQKAAERFDQAARAAEKNDLKNAQKRAAEAEVLLRDAELIAIKNALLTEARGLIAQADEQKIEKFAPRTLQAARKNLAQAEQEITRNRYDTSAPKSLAAEAVYEARHALYLARLIDTTLKKENDDQAGIEELILSWEEPLRSIGTEMEIAPKFDAGMLKAMQDMLAYAQQQRQEIRRLKQDLDDNKEQVAALNAEMQRLESRLGGVSQERIALQRRVDAQERLRANVATVESSFTPAEARVYRQGDDVVVSLLGIKFASGRSAIDASNAALMEKVKRALALFGESAIVVEGHTDSNGSDSTNLILSQDRADAVKQYLVKNFAVDAEKISSIGYGEARPVATNETADGRSRNRRIDLVVQVGPAR